MPHLCLLLRSFGRKPHASPWLVIHSRCSGHCLHSAPCDFGQGQLCRVQQKSKCMGEEEKTQLGFSEPFPCAEPSSAEVEPIVRAQGCFCHPQHLLRSAVCPGPAPLAPPLCQLPAPHPHPCRHDVRAGGAASPSFDDERGVEKSFCFFEDTVLEKELQICCEQK